MSAPVWSVVQGGRVVWHGARFADACRAADSTGGRLWHNGRPLPTNNEQAQLELDLFQRT